MSELRQQNNRYEWAGTFQEKHLPKGAGFRWDSTNKVWFTEDLDIAMKLSEYAIGPLMREMRNRVEVRQELISMSNDTTGGPDLYMVPTALTGQPFPFQVAGARYAMSQFDNGKTGVIFGDEMGLGKTIEAIMTMNAMRGQTVLVTCPKSVELNWVKELQKWLMGEYEIILMRNGKSKTWNGYNKASVSGKITVMVIGYGQVNTKAGKEFLEVVKTDLTVVDECHYLKSPKAQRTKRLLGEMNDSRGPQNGLMEGGVNTAKWLFLSGTPIANRPKDFWTVLAKCEANKWLCPKRGYGDFLFSYCGAEQDHKGYWKFDGATNTDVLSEKLRLNCMVRRLKKDVLKDLPDKRRGIVYLETAQVADPVDDPQDLARMISEGKTASFEELSKWRHEIGVAKIEPAVEYITEWFEDQEEGKQLVVFAHHTTVIKTIAGAIAQEGKTVEYITGATSTENRQIIIDDFQAGKIDLLVASITACAEGITLTNADTLLFAEFDWTPKAMLQAEDRIHRIGQTERVLIQYLVKADCLDEYILQTILEKMEQQRKILDVVPDLEKVEIGTKAEEIPEIVIGTMATPIPEPNYEERYNGSSKAQVEAVQEVLRTLSGVCDGARTDDMAGFNGRDAGFGNSLAGQNYLSPKQFECAKKIIRKYKRQYSNELYTLIYGE